MSSKGSHREVESALGRLTPNDRRELELFLRYRRLVGEAVDAGCTVLEAERAIYPDVYLDSDRARSKKMIVKVQVSLHSSDGQARCLIYNESRSWTYEGVCGEDIVEMMKDRPKAYFHIELSEKEDFAGFEIGDEVEGLDW